MFPAPHITTGTGTPDLPAGSDAGSEAGSVPRSGSGSLSGSGAGVVTVRLWASARAEAGVAEVEVAVPHEVTVAWLRDEVVRRFADRPRLGGVLAVCSALVGDQPVGRADPGQVPVAPGGTVEFLPPFAGG